MNQQPLTYNQQELQQIITNAVQSALSQGGIKSNPEAVSTASSLKPDVEEKSRRACQARMKTIAKQYKP